MRSLNAGKWSKNFASLLAVVAGLPILLLGLWMLPGPLHVLDGETPHVSYADYSAMEAHGALARGWVPSFVPESAVDFEECHNLDTNESWLRFSVPVDDLDAMVSLLVPIGADDVIFPRKPLGIFRQWWPRSLTASDSPGAAYEFYRYDYLFQIGGTKQPKRDFVAVDRTSNSVWHWRP